MKKQKNIKDDLLVNLCNGCSKKDGFCKCFNGNIFNIYIKDIYVKKEIKKIIVEGVIDELQTSEIIKKINNFTKNSIKIKQNKITRAFNISYQFSRSK